MKITIEINCDDVSDVKAHLSVIRQRVIKEINLSDDLGSSTDITFSEGNCFGSHDVTVTFE